MPSSPEKQKVYYQNNKDTMWKNPDGTWKNNGTHEAKVSWYQRNKDKVSARDKANRAHITLRKFKMTVDEYWAIYREQGAVCAICRKPDTTKVIKTLPLFVDHCHVTKQNRGLLCSQCNIMLGMAKDSVDNLRSGADYLERMI